MTFDDRDYYQEIDEKECGFERGYYGDYGDPPEYEYIDNDELKSEICHSCGKKYIGYECPECGHHNVEEEELCIICGRFFDNFDGPDDVCPDCREGYFKEIEEKERLSSLIEMKNEPEKIYILLNELNNINIDLERQKIKNAIEKELKKLVKVKKNSISNKKNNKIINEFLKNGNNLKENGKFNEALQNYNNVIKHDPINPEAWEKRGEILDEQSNYQDALFSYDQAIIINPNSSEIWNNKGVTHFNLKQYNEAVDSYHQAIKLNNKDNDFFYNIGESLIKLKKFNEALHYLNEAIKIDSDDNEVWTKKGFIFIKLGNFKDAIKAFTKASEINPLDIEAFECKGDILYKMGKFKDAIESYKAALELEHNIEIYRKKEMTLAELNRIENEKKRESLKKLYEKEKEDAKKFEDARHKRLENERAIKEQKEKEKIANEIKLKNKILNLISQFNSYDKKLRNDAVSELVENGEPAFDYVIKYASKSKNSTKRRKSCDFLGQIDDPRGVIPLCNLLTDSDRYVRRRAANALINNNDERAIPYLEKALNDISGTVRRRAKEALNNIKVNKEKKSKNTGKIQEISKSIPQRINAPKTPKTRTFSKDKKIHETLRGEYVRSKSEVIIADILYHNSIDYVYDGILEFNGIKKRPDFIIKTSNTPYYWEHLGLLNDYKYRKRWEQKKYWYHENGITEEGGVNGTLIITKDDSRGGISSRTIDRIIQNIIQKKAHSQNVKNIEKKSKIDENSYPQITLLSYPEKIPVKGMLKINQNNYPFYSLGYYQPVNRFGSDQNRLSKNILEFKRGKFYIQSEFADNLIQLIENLNLKFDIIIPIPRSKANQIAEGHLDLTAIVSDNLRIIDGSNFLRRIITVKKSATSEGDRPSMYQHYNSIICDQNINNKRVLLFDDIITQGNTAGASILHIIENKPANITLITLGKTV